MKIALLSLWQMHFKYSSLFPWSSERTNWYHFKVISRIFFYSDIMGSYAGAYWSKNGEITRYYYYKLLYKLAYSIL